jgi:DNA-binding LytR/AlgR family response regulator
MSRHAIRALERWQPHAPSSEGRTRLDVVGASPAAAPDSASPTSAAGRIAARRRDAIVVLDVGDVWAFEARERLCFVHSAGGRFDVDLSLQDLALRLGPGFSRVHRSWLANLANVREYGSEHGHHVLLVGRLGGAVPHEAIHVPVSREYAMHVRARLLTGTVGFRSRRRSG